MKTLTIFALLFFTLSIGITAQDLTCASVKTGDFIEYRGSDKTYISRTKKIQVEFNPKTNIKIKMKVTWLDECTYRLTLINANDVYKKIYGPPKMGSLIVKITEFGPDYYSHEAVFEHDPNSEKYTSKIHLAPKKKQ